jgi:hypothetical protein
MLCEYIVFDISFGKGIQFFQFIYPSSLGILAFKKIHQIKVPVERYILLGDG